MALEEELRLLPTNEISENEENTEFGLESTPPRMKTIPQLVHDMYPTLNNSKERESRPAGNTKSISTRSPLRSSAKRRGLATLQPSATGRGSVVGSLRVDSVTSDFVKQKKESNLLTSPVWAEFTSRPACSNSTVSSPHILTACISTQTEPNEWLTIGETREKDDLAEEALALLRSEPSQEQYYKQIAEERRLALEETLTENEELYDEVAELKEKNEQLEKALSEAESYKLLYMAMLENGKQC